MIPLCTAEQMRELDRRTIEELGIPGAVLMETAGRGMALAIRDEFGPLAGLKVAVMCGRGNNGGDGFVIGRWLDRWGAEVDFLLLADPRTITGDAAVNYRAVERLDFTIRLLKDPDDMVELADELTGFDLIVDALLGTGLNSPVRGVYAAAVAAMASVDVPKAAVDIPSGLSSDSGRVLGAAAPARLTATFGLTKIGQAVHPGVDLCGRLEVIDISIPARYVARAGIDTFEIQAADVAAMLPRVGSEAHKGELGHLLVLGGSPGKTGAACLTAQGALRSGAGLVTVGCPAGLNSILESKLTEAMTEPLPQTVDGALSSEASGALAEIIDNKTALALGPGMSTDAETGRLLGWILERVVKHMVIDADGLNLIAGKPEMVMWSEGELILTPHPGEMARLTGLTAAEIQADRIGAARGLAEKWNQYVVLKGARTVIASPDGRVFINPTGNPGLAAGGSGDVLTGLIGGLLAQGLPPLESALAGVYIHGLAADLLLERIGGRGFTALETAEEIPTAIAELLTEHRP